jgi:hypothetical protein
MKMNEVGGEWRTGKVYTGVWWGNLSERYLLEDSGIRRDDNIKLDHQ